MEAVTRTITDIEWIRVEDESAPGRVRGIAMSLARRIGFSEHRIGEVAIAATELGTNLFRHAQQGSILIRMRRECDEAAIELIAVDSGPGIADLPSLIQDGTSSSGTLGIGLGAITRLATTFDSHSVFGLGTVMLATFWNKRSPTNRLPTSGITRPINGESVCGDAWSQHYRGSSLMLMLADGLGHGELAASAARAAVKAFEQSASDDPRIILGLMDKALRPTRGAAVAIVQIDPIKNNILFAGIGNIAAWVDDGQSRRGLHSQPGIVGSYGKNARAIDLPLPRNATMILHSDGLSSKWDMNTYPGLRMRDPNLIAATLLRDAGIRHDDASVLIAKQA